MIDVKIESYLELKVLHYKEQLKKADNQIIEFFPIFSRYHALLKQAKSLFIDISEKPSEEKILRLRKVIQTDATNS